MKLYDYLSMYKDCVDFDVPDNEIDMTITICYDKETVDKVSEDFPYMDKFVNLLLKETEIDYLRSDGVPICKFSDIINSNLDLFKEHVKKYWTENCQWVLNQDAIDAGEFAYEFIKEFDNVAGGRYGETVNKQYYELLVNACTKQSEQTGIGEELKNKASML